LPWIPRLQSRRTIGIQLREQFHIGLKLEESSREPVQQGAKKVNLSKIPTKGLIFMRKPTNLRRH